jgi:sigma-B regulation protein RsbU (phosphoserine phosphatase)
MLKTSSDAQATTHDGSGFEGADKKMQTDLRQQVDELMLLQRTSQKIGSLLDLDTLLEEIVGDVAETFGYSRSAVLLKDVAADEIVIAAVRGWTANVHRKGERFQIGVYGIIGRVAATGKTYYSPDVLHDPYYEVSEPLTRSELDIPLKARGQLIGVFSVQTPDTDGFSPSRIQVLEALAVHVATAIDNAQLFLRERIEKQRILDELDEARAIQQSLFPSQTSAQSAIALTGMCLPCRAVGGDRYDYIPLPDGRVAVVVADVSGKGMAAALLMSSTRSIVRLLAERVITPSAVLTQLNDILVKDFPRSKFVTMIYALLNPADRTLVFSNAGHNSPLLISPVGAQFVESATGLPLGIREGQFEEKHLTLTVGTGFVMYSDGVSEAVSSDGEEYGGARIQRHFEQVGSSVESLLRDIYQFSGGVPLTDDATAVLVRASES